MEKRASISKDSYKNFFLRYTVAWIICALIVYFPIIIEGRTFIWNVDGVSQHLTALTYYSEYLKYIINSIISGNPSIPEWSYSLGEGGDVFQILSFYCIGDPLALISVFFSAENMVICYNFLALLRCFLAGLALERLINEIKPSIGIISRLVGSVMYAFSFWIVYNITRHPSFVNPCIYFPLIIAGCEKIRNNKKPYYLIVAVALMATSNFYYFYMSVMLTVIYVIIRLGIDIKNRESRKAIKAAYKITIYSLIGALCAGITIVQAIRTFITDPRSEGAIGFSWVYPLDYYKSLISSIFYSNSTFYLCLGIGVPTIVAIILLFKGKDYLTLKIMWILSLIFILIPAIGQVFNGFGYITNRWSFAVAVIAAVMVALMWEDICQINLKTRASILIVLSVMAALCAAFPESRKGIVFLVILLGGVWLLLPAFVNSSRKYIFAVFAVICLLTPVAYYLSANGSGALNELYTRDAIDWYFNGTESVVINELADDYSIRYSSDINTDNAGFYNDVSSTAFYWSNASPYVARYRTDLDIDEYRLFYYSGYNSRASLLSLASVDYYCESEPSDPTPFGFDEIFSKNDYVFYKNSNALPFGYVYDSAIGLDVWDNLNSVERQQLLLHSAVTDNGNDLVPYEVENSINEIPFVINDVVGIEVCDGGIEVTSNNGRLTLSFDGLANSETYLKVNGISLNGDYTVANPKPQYTFITIVPDRGRTGSWGLFTDTFNWYNGREDFIYNLGYQDEAMHEVTLYFSQPGFYSFDSFSIVCVDMTSFESDIEALSSNSMQNLSFSQDRVEGQISMNNEGLLVVPITYSEGWSVYVDGQKQDVINANICYLGVNLDSGNHDIVFEYHNSNIKYGAFVSLIGIISVVVVVILSEKKRVNK